MIRKANLMSICFGAKKHGLSAHLDKKPSARTRKRLPYFPFLSVRSVFRQNYICLIINFITSEII